MKYMISIVLLLFGTNAFAENVQGKDAKNIVLNGEVMGSHMIDKNTLKEAGVGAGVFYSVKSGGKIYYCMHLSQNVFFCESLD